FSFWAVIVAAAGKHIGRGYPWKGFGKGHGDSPVRPSTFESKTRPPRFEGPASVEEMLKELQSVLKESSSTLIAIEADQHYHSTFKEILAVKRGIEKFQFHLIGHEFQVEMDMSFFPSMLQFKRKMLPYAQLLRWSNWFSQWKFTVKHIKGTENVASHKEEGSSSTPTLPIPVFDLPEEIVETIGDLTFEKRAKLCYKMFLTILLKNHGLCIKGSGFTQTTHSSTSSTSMTYGGFQKKHCASSTTSLKASRLA
ncbi:hypothetical protein Tco_0213618, partial [Tanacetum coccineum]